MAADPEAWEYKEFRYERSRCLEYTENYLLERFRSFDTDACETLMQLPCIFAYENACNKAPALGNLTAIRNGGKSIYIRYKIDNDISFITQNDIIAHQKHLDINDYEMNRNHWAVKDVSLERELARLGVKTPLSVLKTRKLINIESHNFDVALSFPGEIRPLVIEITNDLESTLGPNSYFYDDNYQSQLARPDLSLLMQDIYGKRSRLVVAFIGSDYQKKLWCGIEAKAIRQIALENGSRVMYVRIDDGAVDGVFPTDGYIDARKMTPSEIAHCIYERVQLYTP